MFLHSYALFLHKKKNKKEKRKRKKNRNNNNFWVYKAPAAHCLFSHHLSAAAPLPSKPVRAQQRNSSAKSSVKSMIPKPGHHQDLRKFIYSHLHYRSHCVFTSRENTQSCFISKTFSQMDTWEHFVLLSLPTLWCTKRSHQVSSQSKYSLKWKGKLT